MITESDIVLRLLLAAGLGGVIGFERERAHKVAGLRTHSIVSVGAALFSLVSIFLFENFPSVNGVSGFDYHLIANVIVGIGFIGGGAILRQGPRVLGTTTAATLWLVAGVGLASGIGFTYGAVAAAVIGYVLLTLLWQIEKKYIRDKLPYQNLDEPNESEIARHAD
ncbi:MAG TPA: MgtC/SapB family protein [Candidatus Paceibacterota bacterium]